MSEVSESPGQVANPNHEVIEGRTWRVWPTLLTTTPYSADRIRRLTRRLRSGGVRSVVQWENGGTGEGIGATILIDADTPGAAGDIGIRLLTEAAATEGIDTPVIHRVSVSPAWRQEDDWLVQ